MTFPALVGWFYPRAVALAVTTVPIGVPRACGLRPEAACRIRLRAGGQAGFVRLTQLPGRRALLPWTA